MKNMADTFSIDFACLQISPFETVTLYAASGHRQIDMHSWNIFLIEALSMLASPRIKTVKPPDKKPGTCSDRSSFLHRRIVKFQFVWQKQCYNISLAGLLQKHVGLLDSSAKYQKSFVCLRKMCLMVVLWKRMETTTCHRLNSVGNLN